MIGSDGRVEIMCREGKYWAGIYIDLVVDDVCGCMTLRWRDEAVGICAEDHGYKVGGPEKDLGFGRCKEETCRT